MASRMTALIKELEDDVQRLSGPRTRSRARAEAQAVTDTQITITDQVFDRRSSNRIALRLSLQSQPESNEIADVFAPADTELYVSSEDNADAVEAPSKRQKTITGRVTKRGSSGSRRGSRFKKEEDDDDFLPAGFTEVQRMTEETIARRTSRQSYKGYKITEKTTKEVKKVVTLFKANGAGQTTRPHPEIILSVPTLGDLLIKLARKGRRGVQYDNIEYRVKFGWSPYYYHDSPTSEECLVVYKILRPWQVDLDGTIYEVKMTDLGDGPAHGAEGMSVDALVKVFMSQATSNDNALTVQEILIKKFTYTVNGQEVVGEVPNYHKIRLFTPEQFQPYVARAGLGVKRSKHILAALNKVYDENVSASRLSRALSSANPLNAPDFVPGLLSLDFLGTKDMVAIFNWFVKLENFGVKSSACLLEFNYGFPICAVDTHVMKIAAYLGWLPDECHDPNQAFNHLDARIPDYLKHAIHQLFWHHGQKCSPCKRKNNEKTEEGDYEVCPLEHLIKKRFKILNKVSARPKRDADGVIIKREKVTTEIVGFKTFKSAEEAAGKGYVEGKLRWDDDFGADTKRTNAREKKRWEYIGVEEATKTIKKSLITTLFLKRTKPKA